MASFDHNTQIGLIIQEQPIWEELVGAYSQFMADVVIPGVKAVRDTRHVDMDSTTAHKKSVLKLLGFPSGNSLLDIHGPEDLFMLCQEYPQFSSVSGTKKFVSFLSRVLKSEVVVRPLWTRDYATSQKTIVVPSGTPPFISTLDVPLYARLTSVVSKESGKLSQVVGAVGSGQFSVTGNTTISVLFDAQQSGDTVTIDWDAFLPELPENAIRVDNGGHWFLSTHVEAEFDWDMLNQMVREGENIKKKAHDIFYDFAPINLVLRSVGTETSLGVTPIQVSANLAAQIVVQKV